MSTTIPLSHPPPPSPPPDTTFRHHLPLTADHAYTLIDTCATTRRLLEIHAAILRAGLHPHPIVNLKLQRRYSSFGRLDCSLSLLLRLTPSPDVFLFSSLIHAHALHGHPRSAVLLYTQMLSFSITPNAFTFSSSIRACAALPPGPGAALHSQVIRLGLVDDPYVATALIDMYARGGKGDVVSARNLFDKMSDRNLVCCTAMLTCFTKAGDLRRARQLFDEMEEKDCVCWNAMIDGYTQHGRPNESLLLFRRMLRSSTKPNEVTVTSVLSACGQMGALESGRWIHSYIKNNQIRFSARVGTALIDMYCKSGSLEDACLVFDKIKDKDVVTWNSMITGYATHGRSREALSLFSQLHAQGLIPTDITFIGVLNACSHAGLVHEGRKIFHSIAEPKIEHYGCMVDLLGRAGLLEEAYELIQSMQLVPDSVLWGSLLAACRLHKKTSFGEKIATFLLNSGLASSGTYILLSNIYATLGKWEEVAKVRALMKTNKVQKETGCSSIEVNGTVFEFMVGDLRHPRSREIYSKLEEMNCWLKKRGYVPKTEVVTHNLEEEEKEKALGVHSEKLAIALGLISTEVGTTIRIAKNLRVCEDCHEVTKMVSRITGRCFVVRDRNRFHRFVDGACSCEDYW